MNPLLSITIPTFNRAHYLSDLLSALTAQVCEVDPDLLQIFVSDNHSADDTPKVLCSFKNSLPGFSTYRQQNNVGPHRNISHCVRNAKGRYCWILGDDELLQPGALASLLDRLAHWDDVVLLISFDSNYQCPLLRPVIFWDARQFIQSCAVTDPRVLLEHSIISANIFLTPLFDFKVAEDRIDTDYAHMYALFDCLTHSRGRVALPDFPVFAIRENRPPFAQWPVNIDRSWQEYLEWLKLQFDVPELDANRALANIKAATAQKIRSHPVRYVRNNLRNLIRPQGWAFMAKRLAYHMGAAQ